MTQSRLQSLAEAWLNALIGYLVGLLVQFVVYPMYGAIFTLSQHIQISLIFVVVSFVRAYLLRRFFNARSGKVAA